MKVGIAFMILLLSTGLSRAGEQTQHWYRITFNDVKSEYGFYGTTAFNEAEMLEHIKTDEFIKIENLVYFEQNGKVKRWDEWDDTTEPRVYLKCDSIIHFMSLKRDPRKRDDAGK